MWFNLNLLKNIIKYFNRVDFWLSFLFVSGLKKNWNNTLYLNKPELSFWRFSKKRKTLLVDQNKFFKFKKKEKIIYNSLFFFKKISFFWCFFLLLNSLDYLVLQKYKYTLIKNTLLKKNYFLLLKKQKFISLNEISILDNFFLIFKMFYLLDKILLNLQFYSFYVECFFFDFKNLYNYLKTYFLKRCSFKIKHKIWDEHKFVVDNKKVFYEKESRWITKQRDIFSEENKGFFLSIDLDKVFWLWVVYKYSITIKSNYYHKLLYYKNELLTSKLNFLKYKYNQLNKKNYIIKLFLIYKSNRNKILKKNFYINYLMKNLPLFYNRSTLLKLIYFRRKKLNLLLKEKYSTKDPLSLSFEKKKILNIYFFLIYLNFIKKIYLKDDKIFNVFLKKIKNKFLVRKKIYFIFKIIFLLMYKLKYIFKIDLLNINFVFTFLFFFIEKKLFDSKLGYNYDLKLKKSFIIKFLIKNINKNMFYSLLNIYFLNFSIEVDNIWSKRYDILYKTLSFTYRKYWIINNNNLFKILKAKENLIIKDFLNLKNFLLYEKIFKKIYDMYYLFKYNFWSLKQYYMIMHNQLKLLNIIISKKFNLKKKYFFNFNLKSNKFKNSLNIFFFKFLKKKINKHKKFFDIKWSNIFKIFLILKKNILKKFFRVLIFLILENSKIKYYKKKKLPFFLKFDFSIEKSFFFYLEYDLVKLKVKKFKSLFYSILFVYLFNNLNKKFKFNRIKKIHKKKFFLYFLKKRLKKKKKSFKIRNLSLNLNLINSLISISKLGNNSFYRLSILNSFKFFFKIKLDLYNRFLFFFKEFFISDMVLNSYDNFFSWRIFFDLKHDLKLFSFNLKKNKKLLSTFKSNFSGYFFIFFNFFWMNIKIFLYFLNIVIFINKRSIFILWFDTFNNIDNKYKSIYLNDEFFLFNINYKLFIHNIFKETVWYFLTEITFLVKLFSFYFYYFIKKNNEYFEEDDMELKFVERMFIENNNWLNMSQFYLKKFFLKVLYLKKRKLNNKIIYNNLILVNSYYDILKQNNKILNLKNCYLNFKNYYFVCKNCSCLYSDLNSKNIINYYQNLLVLDKLDNNILKFKFIFCSKCLVYKICLVKNIPIYSFNSYNSILKHFVVLKKNFDYIYYKNKLWFCKIFYNYLFFDEVKFITLHTKFNILNIFYCYKKTKDLFHYHLHLNWKNLNYLHLFYYYYFFLELHFFYKNYNNLVTPDLVIDYNSRIHLKMINAACMERKEFIIKLKKKLKIKETKKQKKERKLRLLNKFFIDFINS